MSKFKNFSNKSVSNYAKHKNEVVTNFMGGNSYTINPLDTLRIVAASSIFGEPSYYRDGFNANATIKNHSTFLEYSIFKMFDTKKTLTLFTKVIDASLDFDFKATLELAVRLRSEFNMRLNPSVIFMRASIHPNRVNFTNEYGSLFRELGNKIIRRPDDIQSQFEYYMFINGTKNKLPNVVKRTWSDVLSNLNAYKLHKYKSKSMIDLIRISHAGSPLIKELLDTGNVKVADEDQTWETLKSQGKSWEEIYDTIRIPHMALLRNLRNIFTEINDSTLAKEILEALKSGVKFGKQFPFRYYTAFQVINVGADVNHKTLILDTLEECLDIAIDNFPKLKGKTICLSDNSGSAWGSFNSKYGSVKVAEIANLSSIITALQSDEGEVGVFGDRLDIRGVSKRNGILTQLKETSARGVAQGGGTENGIWLFFDQAIKNREKYDNIFIYSDMQAGHGGLYGTDSSAYSKYAYKGDSRYIDVLKLAEEYRRVVNPKVNLFSVQVAGYNNSVLPENLYRGSILGGWTGNESQYASELIEIWDDVENRKETLSQ